MSFTPAELIAVALGGGLGAVLRTLCSTLNTRQWPWGTLLVNLLGSFALGLLLRHPFEHFQPLWIGSTAGVCGALTTFSTALLETGRWIHAGAIGRAILYLLLTFGGGIALILLALMI